MSTDAEYDSRSHIKRVLDALEAVMERRASSDHIAVSIAGKSVQRMSLDEIYKNWRRYKMLYEQEQAAKGIKDSLVPGRKILTRFSRY